MKEIRRCLDKVSARIASRRGYRRACRAPLCGLRLCALAALACVIFCAPDVGGAAGFVPVSNFRRDAYGGGPQNWGAIQDSIGRMYFGNRDGMLSFDGTRWHMWYIPYGTAVRSMMFDAPEDRIYVGGSQEFGYFKPHAQTGELRYTSLLPDLTTPAPQFSEIWNIFKLENKIWFQADLYLFCYSEGKGKIYPAESRISKSAVVGGRIILGLDNGKLMVFNGEDFEALSGAEPLLEKKISAILPMDGGTKILVATAADGLFIYENDRITPLECDITDFLKRNFTFCGAARDDTFVFGTVNNGAVIKNFRSGETRFINKETGMQNNTVLNVAFDEADNVWLCLDNGIDYADLSSPITNLIGVSNEIGAGYASLLYGSRMLFGTNRGLYSAPYPFPNTPAPMEMTPVMIGQVWSMTRSGEEVFIAADTGVYVMRGEQISRVPDIGGSHMVKTIPGKPNYALVSTYNRYCLLEKTPTGWVNRGFSNGYNDIGGHFEFDSKGNIWQGHWRKGIYRLRFNPETNSFYNVKLISTEDGLPSKENNLVSIINGEAVISTVDGFFKYDETTGKAVPREDYNDNFGKAGAAVLRQLSDNEILREYDSELILARKNREGKYVVENQSLRLFSDMLIHGFVDINNVSDGNIIISNQEGFWNVDVNEIKRPAKSLTPYVNTVYANRDSLVYRALPDGRKLGYLSLPYELNAVKLDFAYADYARGSEVRFSSYLEPYEDEWSPYSNEDSRQYTRLSEGKYTLHLRARTPEGTVAESEFSFRIRPPWFRSVFAYVAYCLIFLVVVAIAIHRVRHWVKDSQLKLQRAQEKELEELREKAEQEALKKDYEIATLKSEQLETDNLNKSKELSHTTMNLIRKNEILSDIQQKISKIQELAGSMEDGANVKRQLSKIQASIRDNISHDTDLKDFMRNFDVVYGNYTKQLAEKHPNLSASDIRMCCYIKMGLSSKDIAPLVNISYKSVEMARYRLRKKMDLTPEVSLSDYLTSF